MSSSSSIIIYCYLVASSVLDDNFIISINKIKKRRLKKQTGVEKVVHLSIKGYAWPPVVDNLAKSMPAILSAVCHLSSSFVLNTSSGDAGTTSH